MPGLLLYSYMKILVTGCFGFIGTNFIEYVLTHSPNTKIVGVDILTYASNKKYTGKFLNKRNFIFYKLNINSKKINKIILTERPDKIINFAAESHVDNSISNPNKFIKSNINGVYNLLYFTNKYYLNLKNELKKNFLFLQVSTDEVFGSLKNGTAKEDSRYDPSSPYSASKAAADHLVNAWNKTYGLPTIITNTCNNYGPYQNKEKFIPTIISSLINEKKIPLYGNGKNIREWIFVKDHVKILFYLITKGKKNQTYNIGTNFRSTNLDIIKVIIKKYSKLNKKYNEKKLMQNIEYVKDRLGHDVRYALNSSKVKRLLNGYKNTSFSSGILQTIEHYMEET